jgi:hypothetical protein
MSSTKACIALRRARLRGLCGHDPGIAPICACTSLGSPVNMSFITPKLPSVKVREKSERLATLRAMADMASFGRAPAKRFA